MNNENMKDVDVVLLGKALDEAFEIMEKPNLYPEETIAWAERIIDIADQYTRPDSVTALETHTGPLEKIEMYVDLDNHSEKHVRVPVLDRFDIRDSYTSRMSEMEEYPGIFAKISDEDAQRIIDNKDVGVSPYLVDIKEVHLGKTDQIDPPYLLPDPERIINGHIDIYTYESDAGKEYLISSSAQLRLKAVGINVGEKLQGQREFDGTTIKNWCVLSSEEVAEIYKHQGEIRNHYAYKVREYTLKKEKEDVIDVGHTPSSSDFIEKYQELLEKYKKIYEECQKAVEEMKQKLIECESGSLSLEEYEEFVNKVRNMEVDMKTQYNLLLWLYDMHASELEESHLPQEPFAIEYKNPKMKGTSGVSDSVLEVYLSFLENYKKLYEEYQKSNQKLVEKEALYKANSLSSGEYKQAIEEALKIYNKLEIQYDWLMNLYEKLTSKFEKLEVPQKPIPPHVEEQKMEKDDKTGKVKVDFLNNGFGIENYHNLFLEKGTIIHPPVIPPEPVNDKNKKKRITFQTFDYWRDQYGRRVDFSQPIEEDLQISAVYKFDIKKAMALGFGAGVGVLAYLGDAALLTAGTVTIPAISIAATIGFGAAAIIQGRQLSRLISGNQTIAADIKATDEVPKELEENVKKEKSGKHWNTFLRTSAIACGISTLIHSIKIWKGGYEKPDPPYQEPPLGKPIERPRSIEDPIKSPIDSWQTPNPPVNQPEGTVDIIGNFTGGTPYHNSYDAGSRVNGMQTLLDYWKNPTPIEAAYHGKVVKISSGQSIDSILQELGANSVNDIGVRIINGATNENLGWINGADIVTKAVAKVAKLGG